MTEASDRVSISAAKQLNIRATFTTGAFKQHLIDFLGLKDLSKTNWSTGCSLPLPLVPEHGLLCRTGTANLASTE